ncbi:MAG: Ig-like domain-containing protein [Oscillospiraceae bacterium]|nr:Ig-like domain-containing protein [Oscillospiraceae bacterium]
MKNMKRLISTLLMLSMMAALLCVPAFAAADTFNVSTLDNEIQAGAGESVTLTAQLTRDAGKSMIGHQVKWYINGVDVATHTTAAGGVDSITLYEVDFDRTENIVKAELNLEGTMYYSEYKVFVRSAPAVEETITLDKYEATTTGETIQLQAYVNGVADNSLAHWTSNNENVAVVSDTGLVTPVRAGTATITATLKGNSGKSASCVISAQDTTKTVVEIVPIVNQLSKGQTINISASVSSGSARFSRWSVDTNSARYISLGSDYAQQTTLTAAAATSTPIRLYAYADDGAYDYIEFVITAAEPLQIEAYPANIDNTESTSVYVVNPIPGEEFTWTVVPSAQYGVLSYNGATGTGSSISLTAGPVEGRVDITATSRSDSSRSDTVTVYVNTEAAYGNAKITPAVATWQRGQAALKFGVSPAYYYAWLDGKALTPESKSYTYYNGVLTLSTGLLSTLSSGEHTLKVQTASSNGQDGLVYATIYVTGSASNVYGDNAHVRGSAYNLYFNSTDPIKEVYISNQWIDPANYVLTNNGTGLTLKSDFLNKLGYGTYSMRLVTQNGYNQNASFRIVTANYAPATGDDANLGAWMVLLTLSLAGAIALVPKRKQSKDLIG